MGYKHYGHTKEVLSLMIHLQTARALAMDSNPCYEASNVKQTEAQEAVHVYERVKQHS
jgi:hypothetical protein